MSATTNAAVNRQKCLNSMLRRSSGLFRAFGSGFDLPLSRGNWERKTYLKLKQRPASRLCLIKVNLEFKRNATFRIGFVLG
ncbi:hypothetical protein V6N13_139847 [Hibiscus sabdariffa]|uniref:Uncharacterized protein n=1 Tax=Hibiscus sabdariffa TaxID=183260 RepID=A0ABR2ATJ4_9ROSI